MQLLSRLIIILGLCFTIGHVAASPTSPVEGLDYLKIEVPKREAAVGPVEVIEFFGYYCPHCNAFDPMLEKWVKKQGGNIRFKRVHVAFKESAVPLQRLFYTLEAMGKLSGMHAKVFHAIHVEKQSLKSDKEIIDFVERHGIDKQRFIILYNSPEIKAQVERATKMQSDFKVNGVPTLIVNQQYQTSAPIVAASLSPKVEPKSLYEHVKQMYAHMFGPKPKPTAEIYDAVLEVADGLVKRAGTEGATAIANGVRQPSKPAGNN